MPEKERTEIGGVVSELKRAGRSGKPDLHESEPHGARKTKKAKRKQKEAFPVGAFLLTILLLAVIFFAASFGMRFMRSYSALKADYEGALQTAEDELEQAKAAFAAADPDSAGRTEERRVLTEENLARAKEEIEALREEEKAADEAIREAEEAIREGRMIENYEYYRAIYDEYAEGRAYVEELLSSD